MHKRVKLWGYVMPLMTSFSSNWDEAGILARAYLMKWFYLTTHSPVDYNAGSNGVGDAAEFESLITTTSHVRQRSSERRRQPVLDLFWNHVAVRDFTQFLVFVVQSTARSLHANERHSVNYQPKHPVTLGGRTKNARKMCCAPELF